MAGSMIVYKSRNGRQLRMRFVYNRTYEIDYRLNGKLHRVGGPALTFETGVELWYVHGCQHRLDGPAVVAGGCRTLNEWFINGHQILVNSNEEFEAWKKIHYDVERKQFRTKIDV